MAGTSAQWNKYDYMSGEKADFLFDSVNQMNNGQTMKDISGSMSEWSLFSVMARANYSYADRYLITATVRHDGSSRFGKNNRWGTFPSVSAAWRPSKESWFPQSSRVVYLGHLQTHWQENRLQITITVSLRTHEISKNVYKKKTFSIYTVYYVYCMYIEAYFFKKKKK